MNNELVGLSAGEALGLIFNECFLLNLILIYFGPRCRLGVLYDISILKLDTKEGLLFLSSGVCH